MKAFFSLLALSTALYALPDELIDTMQEQEIATTEEVALLEPEFIQNPVTSKELMPTDPIVKPSYKSPFLTTTLSTLFPGLGHLYLGDYGTASALIVSAGLGNALVYEQLKRDSLNIPTLVTVQNIWSYSLYAAYRDVRSYNGETGYSYKMPKESLYDLTLAPFRLSVLSKPAVWGGLLGTLAIASTIAYFAFPQEAYIHLSSKMEMPLMAFPIGVGEECLFRGYMQSQLSEYFSPWGGIILSSLAFGAMHIPNAQALEHEYRWRYYSFSLPFITALGTYFGWLTYKNQSLKESVALHTWYDFTLFLAGALASQAAIGQSSFAISLPF